MNTKKKLIWCDSRYKAKPKVVRLPHGGLEFHYTACRHSGSPRCVFTLWCEVGEIYKPYFASFFRKFKLSDAPVETKDRPYLFDQIAV